MLGNINDKNNDKFIDIIDDSKLEEVNGGDNPDSFRIGQSSELLTPDSSLYKCNFHRIK